MSTRYRYDALIIGGGPAGAAAALSLAGRGRSVCMAEADAATPRFKIGESLPPVTAQLLRDLGVWDDFLREGHLPCYGNVSVWGSAMPAETDFIFHPNGHGWHLDRSRFDAFLRKAAGAAGAEVRQPCRVVCLDRCHDGQGWRVLLDGQSDAQEIHARWLIDATGRRAWVARRSGARRIRIDRLAAYYAVFADAGSTEAHGLHDSRTWIEAIAEGWWYVARLPDTTSIASFHTDSDLGAHRDLRRREGFITEVAAARHLATRLSPHAARLSHGPFHAAACTQRLDSFAGAGWLAVGDAGFAFDPLSSQGISHALYSGLKAAQALDAHLRGELAAVRNYCDGLETIFRAYLRHRSLYYAAEQRWPHESFWRRRH